MMHYLGLILVVASWIAGVYLVKNWRGTRAMSLSLHAASNKRASKLLAVGLVALGLAFYYWLEKEFIPQLELGTLYGILLNLTIVCQCIAGIVPDTTGWRRQAHRITAYTMAYLYLPLSLLVLISPNVNTIARVLGVMCLSWMIFALMLFLFIKRSRAHYLVFQSSYIVSFQLIILLAYYLR